MKKLLSLLAITMMAMTAWAEEVQWTEVSTAEEFKAAVNAATDSKGNCTANIKLTKYIDFANQTGNYDAVFINLKFKGKIDGLMDNPQDPLLHNFGFRNLDKPLFDELEDAEFTHLMVADSKFGDFDSKSGQLGRTAINCTFNDVVGSCIEGEGNANTYDCDRMGLLVGTATSCTFTDLMFLDCKIITDGSHVGSVVGEAFGCSFLRCVVNAGCEFWADGNLTSDNSAYVGGIAGYADNCGFSDCANFGVVSSDDDRIGGIVGYGCNGTVISDCKNGGVVMNTTKEGMGRLRRQAVANGFLIAAGISGTLSVASYLLLADGAGYFASQAMMGYTGIGGETMNIFINLLAQAQHVRWGFEVFRLHAGAFPKLAPWATTVCAALPEIFLAVAVVSATVAATIYVYNWAAQPDEMGGIVGTLEGSTCEVLRCTNQGPVECKDDYVGGIVGKLIGGKIENCYNRAIVKGGDDSVGGIVGYCKDAIVRNNLNAAMATTNGVATGSIEGKVEGTCTRANNYYLAEENKSYGSSTAFTQEKLPSGEVALALNNAIKSDEKQPLWRQKLGTDFNPVIDDESKPLVTATTSNYSIVQKIHDGTEFFIAAYNPNAQLSLENDIDLKNYYFNISTSGYPFKGKIIGNGHTIKNCSYQTSEYAGGKDFALFPYATGAQFRDFTIDGFHITQKDEQLGSVNNVSLLVANSTSCQFNNITVRNSYIYVNEDRDYLHTVGALSANSLTDTFTSCTVENTVELQGYSGAKFGYTNVGGICGYANSSTFTRCHGGASIWADDDDNGGIVGWAKDCTIEYCLHSGIVKAQKFVGGIVGYLEGGTVNRCVNTGIIDDDESKRERCRAGIVGARKDNSAVIKNCMNFGSVNFAEEDYCGPIMGNLYTTDGSSDKTTNLSNNYYYCQYNGNHIDNDGEVSAGSVQYSFAEMQSGKYAYNTDGFYQTIDNHIDFPTNLPVPIPAAGQVYSNILCDGTLSYSNRYHSEGSHTSVADAYGKCSICGKEIDGAGVVTNIHIADADGLNELARYVNNGTDLSHSTVYLDNDIDMKSITNFTPIGTWEHPFEGTFVGNFHRIKNLVVNRSDGNAVGLFGTAKGLTTIKELIIDKSCQFTGTGYGAAGFVGCLKLAEDIANATDEIDFKMYACGNEADVTGNINAASLVGGVYNTDNNGNCRVVFEDCYNTGNIKGNKESAVFIGYGNKYVDITNCYNLGTVTGYDVDENNDTTALVRLKSDAFVSPTRVYNLVGVAGDARVHPTVISDNDVQFGKLCADLRSSNTTYKNAWTQNLETDAYPTFGTSGVHYARTMSNAWGTVVLPFDVTYDQSNGNYKLYKLSAADAQKLTFTEYPDGTIAAGTPMAVKKISGDGIDIASASTPNYSTTITEQTNANASLPSGWTMNGTYTNLTNQKDIYFIASNQFWWAESPITIASFRAWFAGPTPTSGGSAKFNIVIEDEETSLSPALSIREGVGKYLENGKVVIVRNGVKYNLNGQAISF